MYDRGLVEEILSQIKNAVETVIQRFEPVQRYQDFLDTHEGKEKLDAICMQLIAIGESVKKIDKISDKALCSNYPEINWKGIKGIRDVISHQYFDIDAEEIFWICSKNMKPLLETIRKIIDDIKEK